MSVLADDYIAGEAGTIYTQVLNGDGTPANSAIVTLTLWNSAGGKEIDAVNMTYIVGSNGLYKYDFTSPISEGVYVAEIVSTTPIGYGSGDIHVTSMSSVNATDIWGENMTGYADTDTFGGALNDIGGKNMTNIVMIGVMALIALAFVCLYLWKREIWLGIVACIVWLLFGVFCASLSTGATPLEIVDIWGGLAWVGISLALVFSLAPFIWRRTPQEQWEEDEDDSGQPIMVMYKNGTRTYKERGLTDLEAKNREQRIKEQQETKSRPNKPSSFSETGRV